MIFTKDVESIFSRLRQFNEAFDLVELKPQLNASLYALKLKKNQGRAPALGLGADFIIPFRRSANEIS